MRFLKDEGGSWREVSPGEVSAMNVKQAAAVMDAIGRLVPHEGVDYVIKDMDHSFDIEDVTDKGAEWCRYVNRMILALGHPALSAKEDLASLIGSLIPQDGVDYESIMAFGEYPKLSYRIVAKNDKGVFWRDYVAKMLVKYPPDVQYKADMLPDDPEPVEGVPEEFKEVLDEKIVH